MKNTNVGQILKSKSTESFTVIPNEILRNSNLSLQAKGLICYLLSLPKDWVIYKTEIAEHSTNGRDATMKAFNELIKAGYILSVEIRNDKGHFKGFNYIVYNTPNSPITENPKSGNPISDNPISENPQLLNKEYTKERIYKRKRNSDSENRGTPSLFEEKEKETQKPLSSSNESDTENKLPIKAQSNSKENTRGEGPDRASKKSDEETFTIFWNHWHKLSGQSKTDRESAFKHWKKLSLDEKRKAFEISDKFIKFQLKQFEDIRFLKKARTYLADKSFNDELKISPQNSNILSGSFFNKKGYNPHGNPTVMKGSIYDNPKPHA